MKRILGYLRRNIVRFVENHERSFRTDIILLPTLVVAIKLFTEYTFSDNFALQLAAIIAMSFVAYLIGLTLVTIIGDAVWSWLHNRLHPSKKYHGCYYQIVEGVGERRHALAHFFRHADRGQYLYRGIAFNDAGEIKAAWDGAYTRMGKVGGTDVIQFIGKAQVFDAPATRICYAQLSDEVFFFMNFGTPEEFVGAGMDLGMMFQQSSFTIQGFRAENLLRQNRLESCANLVRKDDFSCSVTQLRKICDFGPFILKSREN